MEGTLKSFKERSEEFNIQLEVLTAKHQVLLQPVAYPRNLFAKVFKRFIRISTGLNIIDNNK